MNNSHQITDNIEDTPFQTSTHQEIHPDKRQITDDLLISDLAKTKIAGTVILN
ncbi:hypothetical protein [uncultured Shewanella sp.]|uniref:hypothetical protein n=1 Tax=uncultured Shewanella sp. TaxID=173975 RepID=UPI002634143C|nr:hypothetical protein [uncultured Shewanella sp.]